MRSLVEAGVGRLAHQLPGLHVAEVLVDLRERVVFVASTANGAALVVKVDLGAARFEREVHALGAGRDAGLPVPAIHFADPGPPSVIALARVDGRPLRDGSVGEWERVGRQLRLLHGVAPPDGLPPFFGHGDSWCDFVCWWAGHEADVAGRRGLLDPSEAARLRDCLVESFVAMPEPECRFIHGDCQPDHFLLADGAVVGIVDFGDAGTGDPMWDIAVLTTNCTDKLNAAVAGYGTSSELQETARLVVPAYWLLRHLAAANWLSDHGFDPAAEVAAARRSRDRL